jgi:hypothetical protein
MTDADLLDLIVERLWRARDRLGSAVYRAAAQAALQGIAAAILEEAERRAGVRRNQSGTVIWFPRHRTSIRNERRTDRD